MYIFSGRIRLIVTALTYAVLLYLYVDGRVSVILVGSIVGFMSAWCFGFDLKVVEIVPFLLIPSLYAANMAYVTSIFTQYAQIVAILTSVIGMYLLLLTLNILNVATVKEIPLRRPALSSLYLHGLLSYFVYAWAVLNTSGWGIQASVLTFWVSMCLYGLSYLFIVSHKARLSEQILWIVLSLEIVLIPSFFFAAAVYTALFMVGWLFILLGIMQHNSEKLLTKGIIREYASIGLMITLLYFLL